MMCTVRLYPNETPEKCFISVDFRFLKHPIIAEDLKRIKRNAPGNLPSGSALVISDAIRLADNAIRMTIT